MIAIGVVNVPIFARLLRGSILGQRETDYVLAARSIGVPSRRILSAHILPNAISPVIVAGTLALATAIIDVAGLGFLGLGPQDPATPEWGTMLTGTVRYLADRAVPGLFPGLAIVLVGARLQPDRRRPARSARPEAAWTCLRPPGPTCSTSRACDVAFWTDQGTCTPSTASRSTIAAGETLGHRRRVGLRQERDVARAARHPAARGARDRRAARTFDGRDLLEAVRTASCGRSAGGRSR